MEPTECFETSAHKIQMPEFTQKNEYNKTEFAAQHRQSMARLWIRQDFGTSKQITCNSDPSGPHNSENT